MRKITKRDIVHALKDEPRLQGMKVVFEHEPRHYTVICTECGWTGWVATMSEEARCPEDGPKCPEHDHNYIRWELQQ